MTIHFVCMGNAYRSRLAEAYFRSLKLSGYNATSSGVTAERDLNGPVARHAVEAARRRGLMPYMKDHWDQLTQAKLDEADLVVCINRSVYQAAKARFVLPLQTIIWDIPDVYMSQVGDAAKVDEIAYRTCGRIMARVDELMAILSRLEQPSNLVDVLHPDGRPTGRRLSVTQVNRQGLWRAGAHGILYTGDGKVVIQQRSTSIIGNPGRWEISLGGSVDAGEVPLQTLVREAREELGLRLKPAEVTALSIKRYSHYLPRYGFHSRVLLHCFMARISNKPAISLQQAESQNYQVVPIDDLRRMIAGRELDFMDYSQLHAELLTAVERQLSWQPAKAR